MLAPVSRTILDVWERGLRQPLQRQVMALLAAVLPDTSEEEIAAMPVGRRDGLLLDLRAQMFGPGLETVAACPACNERLESAFQVDDIRAVGVGDGVGIQSVKAGGQRIRFRLPATSDLLAIPDGADESGARDVLLSRCLIDVHDSEGRPVAPGALPPAAVPAIAARMAKADPQADVTLALDCPACGTAFQAAFDIASFLMAEISSWAQAILRDVHSLARAYGWSEEAILSLSPTRRQSYLDLARQ